MALATWWATDPVVVLPSLPDFEVRLADDDQVLAEVNRLSIEEVLRRKQAGHRAYLGYAGEMAVTYGWVATQQASIGELDLEFAIPTGDRYLWDFATVPAWQGKGLYPRVLGRIVQAEQAERFWIIHAPENLPSGAGIQRAGFLAVGQLSFRPDGRVGMIPLEQPDRARLGASLLGVELIDDELSPCWRCMDQVVCTCKLDPERCSCAVPVRRASGSEGR